MRRLRGPPRRDGLRSLDWACRGRDNRRRPPCRRARGLPSMPVLLSRARFPLDLLHHAIERSLQSLDHLSSSLGHLRTPAAGLMSSFAGKADVVEATMSVALASLTEPSTKIPDLCFSRSISTSDRKSLISNPSTCCQYTF